MQIDCSERDLRTGRVKSLSLISESFGDEELLTNLLGFFTLQECSFTVTNRKTGASHIYEPTKIQEEPSNDEDN